MCYLYLSVLYLRSKTNLQFCSFSQVLKCRFAIGVLCTIKNTCDFRGRKRGHEDDSMASDVKQAKLSDM